MNSSFHNIKTIAKRELTGYFASPVAYVFIVIFLLMNGFFTFMLGGFFERGEASLAAMDGERVADAVIKMYVES